MQADTTAPAIRDDADVKSLQARVATLSSLIETSIIISSSLDLDEVINLVMEKAQSVMRCEASIVLLINEESGYLECEVALGEVGSEVMETIRLKIGEGIAGWVAQTGECVIVPDAQKDPRFARQVDDSTGFITRSILAVPLKVQDRIIGVAEVLNPVDGEPFTEDDLELFSTFGRQVAMAIENARMHGFKLAQQRLEQQLEAARIIQESFIPQTAPPNSGGAYQLAARSIAASSIGGDLYDFLEFDSETLGLLVGDVAGKGIPAALYMARLISDFRFQTQTSRDPESVLYRMNNSLVDRSRRGMFVTGQYMLLDFSTGALTLSDAGHLPIIKISGSDNRCECIQGSGGAPLGIVRDMSYAEDVLQLSPGDTLVMITDGIIEAKNCQNEQFTLERLVETLQQEWQSADAIVDTIIAEIQDYSKDVPQHDDLTVVALRWSPN